MKSLITVEEATRLIDNSINPLDAEIVSLSQATGRILREPLLADRDFPPYDRVMMDGYAISATSWLEGRRSYSLSGEQSAGSFGAKLASPEHCVGVATGSVLPNGTDAVLPVEWSEVKVENIVFAEPTDKQVESWLFVHRRGSDHLAGTELVATGIRLYPAEVAIAASCGFAQLCMSRRPKVAIMGSGDELVPIEEIPGPHQIRQSNVHALAASCRMMGLANPEIEHAPDDPLALGETLERLSTGSDVLLLTGGVSRGRKDYLPNVLIECGFEKIFHGVNQTPGKPMWFGKMPNGPLAFGLPGNPISAVVGFVRYAQPALWGLQGLSGSAPPLVQMGASFYFAPQRSKFLPVYIEETTAGIRHALPSSPKNSGDLAALVGTDGFVELSAKKDVFPKGLSVPFYQWTH